MTSLEPQKLLNEILAHLEKMEKKLMHLKVAPDNQEILNSVFNSVHTIRRSSKHFGTKYKASHFESTKPILNIFRRGIKGLKSKILTQLNRIKDQIERIFRNIWYHS